MRTEQLEYIAAVTRLGSLRRAAEELRLSQPALSETVRNLESELGVDLLERKRSGARMSASGRELLPHIVNVLEGVDRLRAVAGEQHRISRMVRLGTVNAATVPLLIPVVRNFRGTHPLTQVEVVGAQQADIHRALLEGAFDLGLVNHLDGDDMPAGFESTELLRGRAGGVRTPGQSAGVPGGGDAGRPARGAADGHAVGLCDAPLRPSAAGRAWSRVRVLPDED